jgi:hypothetical protein
MATLPQPIQITHQRASYGLRERIGVRDRSRRMLVVADQPPHPCIEIITLILKFQILPILEPIFRTEKRATPNVELPSGLSGIRTLRRPPDTPSDRPLGASEGPLVRWN